MSNCNYKTDKKRSIRCGADTIDGAKMCPEHQGYMRDYMKKYRARKKTQEKKQARRETIQTVARMIDDLLEAQAPKRVEVKLLPVPQGRDDWDDDTLADIRAFLNRADELQAWLNQWGIPR